MPEDTLAEEVKEWNYAAYVFLVREIDGKKQIAFLVYGDWYGAIGGRQDGDETPREALIREICEEFGDGMKFIANAAIEMPEKYRFKVNDDNVLRRRARNEEHTFFVSKVPADSKLTICEEHLISKCKIVWLNIEALEDGNFASFGDLRDVARAYMPVIKSL